MAIYHFSAQVIGRKAGRSAVAAAAYRAGEKLRDERAGKIHDFGRKGGVAYSEIMVPANAAEWVLNREKLWNAVEAVEKRKDAQLAREINVALPVELSRQQQLDLVREFVQSQFVKKGMVADVAVHDSDDGNNPHAHIMLTMREVKEDGFGNKVRAWNDKKLLEQWREKWADCANAALERADVAQRIDHRSLKEQGVEREPQIHVGVTSWHAKKRKKIETHRYKRFKEILKRNEIYVQLDELDTALMPEQQQEQNGLMALQRKLHELEQQRDEAVRKARHFAEEANSLSSEAFSEKNRARILSNAYKKYLNSIKSFNTANRATETLLQRFLAKVGIVTQAAVERENSRIVRQCAWRDLVEELGFKPKNTKQVQAEIESCAREAEALSDRAEAASRKTVQFSHEISELDKEIKEISAEIYEELEPQVQPQPQARGWEMEM